MCKNSFKYITLELKNNGTALQVPVAQSYRNWHFCIKLIRINIGCNVIIDSLCSNVSMK